MPYTHCPSCRLSTFSAAIHSSRDECPRCGTELSPRPRRLFLVEPPAHVLAEPSAEQPPQVA
jgi:hypothetical protein